VAREPYLGQRIIAAELAELGYQISPRTVAKYRPSNLDQQRGQRWTTFMRNHLHETWACDFFVLITARFRVLYVFIVLSLGRRTIVHAGVTEHPTARWAAQRIAEATSDAQQIPRFLVHDRDSIYPMAGRLPINSIEPRPRPRPLRPDAAAQHGVAFVPASIPPPPGRHRPSIGDQKTRNPPSGPLPDRFATH
jgi:hypothetical protein